MKLYPRLSGLGFCVLAIFLLTRCNNTSYEASIDTVASPIAVTISDIRFSEPYFKRRVVEKTSAFYEANEFQKHWLDKRKPFKRYNAFMAAVAECDRYGLNPADYHHTEIQQAVDLLYSEKTAADQKWSELDIKITASFFLFTTHLLEGRIRNPGSKEFIWKKGMPQQDDVSLLLANKSKGELKDELEKLHPDDKQYVKLRGALNEYRLLAENSKIPALPEKIHLKVGKKSPAVPLLRRRLEITDIPPVKVLDDSLLYDSALMAGVKKFQTRHGLKPDGIVNEELARLLTISFSDLSKVLALNLERLRWKPSLEMKDRVIVVNVPEYMLKVYDDEKLTDSMRVVLGSEFNATPIFSDTMKYLVFSPTWNVPHSIFEEEFLPNLIENPEYYNPEVFKFYKGEEEINPAKEDWKDKKLNARAYRAVQMPGPQNSLGNVKFILPNNFAIYLHDTPADRLFAEQDRAFSHGCVRLERPAELAALLLDDQKDWDLKKIKEAMALKEPKTVNLKEPVPVHIIYRTAWVDEEGTLNFRKDVYGHDARQLNYFMKDKNIITPVKNK